MARIPILGEMDMVEFRSRGRQLIEWIADYLEHPERYPVLSRNEPGALSGKLPSMPPETSEGMAEILADFEEKILPGITHWNHPGFFAYYGITGSGPSILGELLSSALNVNAMMWHTSPSATELEELTLDWLRQMMGLPDGFKGVITDSASISSLLAIAAARESLNLDIRQRGLAGRDDLPRLRLYISEQTHSSIEKAAITLGIGQEGVRKIAVDEDFAMDPYELAQAIAEDSEAGWLPFCVVATIGTTSTSSVDPVPLIADLCQLHDLWLHVDAAYGGAAAILPEFKHLMDGVEGADSLVVNPHKWLFTNIDCSALYVRRPDKLRATFSLVPEYLNPREDEVTNYMEWGIQLGRRFRALKLWMVIRYFGVNGLQERIREHIRIGHRLAWMIERDPNFQKLAPSPLSTICFRACPAELERRLETANDDEHAQIETYLDDLNKTLLNSINNEGEIYISSTVLNKRFSLRMAVGNIRTDEPWVNRAWEIIKEKSIALDQQMRPKSLG